MHRRRTDDLYKDTDDIRENIINYEDEGGGEGDMTGYDLNVLRLIYNNAGQPMTGKEPVKTPLVSGGRCTEVSGRVTVKRILIIILFLFRPPLMS